MLRQSLDPSKLMDPRKVLKKRYQMMGLHIGMIVALIAVSATEVRSGILLGIHGTSCLFFLIYIPRAAYLSYKRSRTSDTATQLAKGNRDVEAGRETRWDAAAAEVGYLGWQCCTTLVSSVLCTISLRSTQCYGRGQWALDEFAQIKERDVDDWCQGVIGATVLSYVQLVLDLTWLGWVVWLCRSAGDVVDPLIRGRGDVDIEGGGEGGDGPRGEGAQGRRSSSGSGSRTLHPQAQSHAQKVLAALHTPVPLILLKLAAHRSEQEIIRLESLVERNRNRLAQARANARNIPLEHDTPSLPRHGSGTGDGGSSGTGSGGGDGDNDARSRGIFVPARLTREVEPEGTHHMEAGENIATLDRGYREVPPPYMGKEGGAPGYVTPGRELEEGVFFGGAVPVHGQRQGQGQGQGVHPDADPGRNQGDVGQMEGAGSDVPGYPHPSQSIHGAGGERYGYPACGPADRIGGTTGMGGTDLGVVRQDDRAVR